ncbi:hypothetical protein H4R33_006137 [Dimargaris cristalligena]|uniref:Cytochrome c oxidase assembly protein n=1 Tax=Dimargaris cristalligena TaxID=215637 RepID=A0A4Q0A1A4_9FUNG|nr:hypothetical protein H4R33_006137 [Dimargaris cristalligena]RKP38920.1 hypothetical protein BJ085DRAFT_17252 [Dimargaris cristalligena]|eukprot:RKP38920.1 hypothetical protein BJ085DRAFT_17252 [Dimargaris cristalligena]
MSHGGKMALLASLIFSGAVIYGVHYQQRQEREIMHYGIIKDEERRRRKLQNQAELEVQRSLQAEYEKEQNISR